MSTPPLYRACLTIALSIVLGGGIADAQAKARVPGITVKQIGTVGHNAVRIRRDPASGRLYVLQNTGLVQRVDLDSTDAATLTTVYQTKDHGLNAPLGMAFGQDGTMYLVGNDSTGPIGTATIVKGVPDTPGSEIRTWSVIAQTVPYQYGNIYNHRMSGIVVNPAGDSIYVNSGAATDHGEMHGGYREVGLTSIILKLPTHGNPILLQDDRGWLRSNGYLFAEGIRNSFDFAYSGSGDLIDVQNSGDRDDPEEMNWLREGHHYGFPWRISTDNTPQQFVPYNPHADPLLSPNAWGGGNLYVTFSNDTSYPPRPDSVTFTDPIPSVGPDADHFRDTVTGAVKDASALGATIQTLTPHRSPDGIVFDKDSLLSGEFKGGAFVISVSNSSLVTALGDTSDDLLLVNLTKQDGDYSARVTRLVSGFNSPLGIEIVGNKLFVMETGLEAPNTTPKLWLVTLPLGIPTAVTPEQARPQAYALFPNYPNPFNPTTTIRYAVPEPAGVTLAVFDVLGRRVRTLVSERVSSGTHAVVWDGRDEHGNSAGTGVYFYRLTAGANPILTGKMILLK